MGCLAVEEGCQQKFGGWAVRQAAAVRGVSGHAQAARGERGSIALRSLRLFGQELADEEEMAAAAAGRDFSA